ncbi:SagB/ThcOx family dehydrogenase [Heyndrickxia sporothermodurans]|uniref:SagB/ThcOx family dehydrogenase n=1 Tax=Heyndrickxia sporothermodurans TaxID=46224 RepID=UPI002E1F992D|nr:SagB/ThcOx family dehydrogenase [Heyndrickxia sporothermodurans]MED3696809.1 SagB/ThcOx family dehydrogenase [Heyndrickxia sporothermodurans]MED3780649.1 SagB/ThcOx family dehydrogenase [Heyndrickxia sporothermodurans]
MSSINPTRTRVLHTHASIRFEPPMNGEQSWIVTTIRRRFRASVPACAILVSFVGGRVAEDVIAEVAQLLSVDPQFLETVVSSLEKNGLLVEPENDSHNWALQIKQRWSSYGWSEAAEYQIASYDYPFVDYAADGRLLDATRMKDYSAEEPDVNRMKPPMHASEILPVITAGAALDKLTESFDHVWNQACKGQSLDEERLKLLLSTLFGTLRHKKRSPHRADLIRKTSPSGGSRHPTEGYVFVKSVDGMDPGIYHFSVAANALERVGSLPDEEVLFELFSGPIRRAQFQPQVLLVMTTCFERNMYRYREPRTLRSVFMDIGHLCVTMETVANSLGLRCQFHHAIDDENIESLLGLHPLEEGAMFSAALAGGV